MNKERKEKIVAGIVGILLIVGMYQMWIVPISKDVYSFLDSPSFQPIIQKLNPIVYQSKDMEINNYHPDLPTKYIIWDLESNSIPRSYYLLPEELRARPNDSNFLVFIIHDKINNVVGQYNSKRDAVHIDVKGLLIQYPENMIIGNFLVSGEYPSSSRFSFESTSGDINAPIATFLQDFSSLGDSEKRLKTLVIEANLYGKEKNYPSYDKYNYPEYKLYPQYNEIRDIGLKIDRIGGINLMKSVFCDVNNDIPDPGMSKYWWDYIGEWMMKNPSTGSPSTITNFVCTF